MKYPLAIVTFLFSAPKKWVELLYEPYAPKHVNALWRMCEDTIKVPHRFVAFTDRPDGIECERRESLPRVKVRKPDGIGQEDGCYQRLRLYDPELQASLDAEFVLILDLDMVMMRDCTALIEACMAHDFTALRGSPWPNGDLCSWYNGGFQMCRTGARPQFWTEFDTKRFYQQREAYMMPSKDRRYPRGRRPHGTDQAWLSVCAGPGEHTIWHEDGVYQYRNHRQNLPADANILFFAGREKPWMPSVAKDNPAVAERWAKYLC
jgi:hypothetical protein